MAKDTPPTNSPAGGGGAGFFKSADLIGLQTLDRLESSSLKKSPSKDRPPYILNYIATGKNVISLRLAWASNISRDLSGIYLAAAKQLAYPHGLNLVPVPSSGQTKDHTFNFEGTVADGDGQAYSRVRGLAETAHKKAEPSGVLSPATLYVIFCRFDGGYGTTVRDRSFWPFSLINTEGTPPKDGMTLLHEIGHAAGLPHPQKYPNSPIPTDVSIENNFMTVNLDRFEIFRYQIEKIDRAFFSGGPPPKLWWETKPSKDNLYTYGD